jgi:hypothetical protein
VASLIWDLEEVNVNLPLQCQKIFKNPALASFHGEKSGHTQFEESTEEVGRLRLP